MPIFRFIPFALAAALSFPASAETAPHETLIARFSSIAMPIAKGAVLEDNKGCFWWVRDGAKTPEIAALVDDKKGGQLCREVKIPNSAEMDQERAGGDRE